MSRVIRTLTDSIKSDCLINFDTYFCLLHGIRDARYPMRGLGRALSVGDSGSHLGLLENYLLYSSMNMSSHMYLECAWPHEGLATLSAFEGSVSWMPSQMVCQVTLSSECFLTPGYSAWERLLTRVYSQMSLKVPLFCECFSASDNRALKRFLASLKLIIFDIGYVIHECANVS